MPRYYPVFLDVAGRRCAVFGGNHEAERKALYLLECGALPAIFSPEADMTDALKGLAQAGKVEWQRRAYRQGDLENVWIAIVADTSDPARNERLFAEARSRNVPLNTLDVTPMCTFIAPAVVQRKDVTVAISTAGTSPALARKLRVEMSSHDCLCMRWSEVAQLSPGRGKRCGPVRPSCAPRRGRTF